MDENYELIKLGPKKKRGRPRKADTILLPGEISALGLATPPSEFKSRKPRVVYSDASQSADAKQTLIGQPVQGVVDGSFDAGYLVTVRVGDSDTVYRGVVFGPGLSIPLSKDNDVAPKVKNAKRDEGVTVVSPASPSPTAAPPSSVEISRGMGMVPVPPVFTGLGAHADMRLVAEQQMSNPVQQGFIHHPSAQLQSAQAYVAHGYSNPFHLAGTDFVPGHPQFGVGGQGASHGS